MLKPANNGAITSSIGHDGSATFTGDVGIGTTSADANLHIKGSYPTVHIERDHAINYARLLLDNTSNDGAAIDGIGDSVGGLRISTSAAGTITERMRIDSNGLMWSQTAGHGHFILTAQGAGTTYAFLNGRHSSTGFNTGTSTFWVYTNGNVQNANNSYGAISDIKLKENIVDANSQWDDLKAIQIRNYNFIEGQTHTQIGVVAQEVELVSPGLVTESPDRDEEDNDLGTVTKSVNYSVLYMKAVKALQEAMERIETLEQRLSDAGVA